MCWKTGTLAEYMERAIEEPPEMGFLFRARHRSVRQTPAQRRDHAARHNPGMNIVILDDYQDAVRKLQCATKLEPYPAKVFTNTVKGIGQLSVRLRDADVIVLIRERSAISRQLVGKLPRLNLIPQTARVAAHVEIKA